MGDHHSGEPRDPFVLEVRSKVVAVGAAVDEHRLAVGGSSRIESPWPTSRTATRSPADAAWAPACGPSRATADPDQGERREPEEGRPVSPRDPQASAPAGPGEGGRDGDSEQGVRRQDPADASHADVDPRPARLAQPVGHLRHVGRQQAGEPGERLDRRPRDLPDDAGQHPQPHHRGDRRQGEQVRGQRGHRDRVEGARHQGRRRERRRDRHAGALGEQAPPPGIQPRGPARPRNRSRRRDAQSRIPITAAKLSCQPTSPLARGLRARVRRRRPAPRKCGSGSSGQRRDHPGGAHDPGALNRRTGAGERHVESDQGHDADQPGPKRQPEERQQRRPRAARAASPCPRRPRAGARGRSA